MELMQANKQWSSRPADERFVSLHAMLDAMRYQRQHSKATVVSSRDLTVMPEGDSHTGLVVQGPTGHGFAPTHWSFGQLATLAEAPAGYLRTVPSELAADCLNYGLKVKRGPEDVGVLLYKDGHAELRAATGPAYGRIWNESLVSALIQQVGDGVSGQWKVPGEFGQAVEVTKENTTLYASDRDMFVFLADEENRIDLPNRRNGKTGSLARGFFLWNSEVGKSTVGIATFLFDYVCCNRIVWGAEGFKEIKLRHTSGAPDRWLREIQPALLSYSRSSSATVLNTVQLAQQARVEDLDKFLLERFTKPQAEAMQRIHIIEEGRPIETLWDATTAVTAYARDITYQDERLAFEREGGKILSLAAA